MPSPLDLDFIRGLYPSRCWDWAFFENAGGSFVPESVVNRVTQYMRETQVQPGAGYEASAKAGERMATGQRLMAEMVGARVEEVIIGPSTTMNVYVLANAFAGVLKPGDEIIVTNLDHEANNGAWRRLAETGITVNEWKVDPETAELDLAGLEEVDVRNRRVTGIALRDLMLPGNVRVLLVLRRGELIIAEADTTLALHDHVTIGGEPEAVAETFHLVSGRRLERLPGPRLFPAPPPPPSCPCRHCEMVGRLARFYFHHRNLGKY